MDNSITTSTSTTSGTTGTANRAPPPPIPPSRRSTVILPSSTISSSASSASASPNPNIPPTNNNKTALAPSPPPKPSSLQSPLPPRKPISLAAAAIATIASNSFSSPAPIPAPRPSAHSPATHPHQATSPSSSALSTSPSFSSSTSPSFVQHHQQQQQQQHPIRYQHSGNTTNNNSTLHHQNGFTTSDPGSSASSPTSTNIASFPPPATFSSSTTLSPSTPANAHLHPHLRSQTIPSSPAHLRPSGSTSFLPAAASSSIAAKQHLLFNTAKSPPQHDDDHHSLNQPHSNNRNDNVEQEDNPFSDPSNVDSIPPTHSALAPTVPSPVPATSPSFVPRAHNQSSLLTARLQAIPPAPSPLLHSPVPHYGGLHSTSPRSNAVSSPPPIHPSSVPSLPPRSRSPLSGVVSSPQQPTQPQHHTAPPTPARQNIFSTSHRLSGVPPVPPSFPAAQNLAMASPSQPVPPPPRRTSVQLAPPPIPQQQQHHHPQAQQPKGPSPLFPSSGESGMSANASRFRNMTAPQQAYDHLAPQTPKRVFSSSSSPSPFGATSPVPERGFAQQQQPELSDSQSDSDETSDDSDKDYDDVEEYQSAATPSNPFRSFVDASPRPTRARTFKEPPTPPSLPARPNAKGYPGRPSGALSDQEVAPALPPKPSMRKRPQPPQDPGSLLSLAESESETGRNNALAPHHQSTQQAASGASPTDGVFPDYSRSNRRLPLFSDSVDIHDIGQKSHGVRAFSISHEQVATATSNIRVYSLLTGENVSSYGHEKDNKPTALMFTQSRRPDSLGQYLWAGWNDGSLQVIDTRTKEVMEKKRATHKGGCVTHIIRSKGQVWTVDDTGSVFVWPEDGTFGRPTIQSPLQSLTIPPKQICAIAVQDTLWSSDGSKVHVVRVGHDAGRPKLAPTSMDIPYGAGPLTCLATIAGSGQVFSGHEDGKVILWSIETREKVRIINVHAYRIMSLLGVGSYLWAGFATGKIYVLDLRPEVPVVMKDWQAHKESGVSCLQLDEEGLILGGRHQVGSCAENGEIKIWDGLMAKDRLTKGMVDRSKEYCHWRDLKILICSWNIDASKPTAQDANGGADRKLFESWLTGMDQEGPPDIISVGFQEIVDLESKKMTAKSLLKGSKRAETETISKQYKRWQIYLTTKIRELYAPMGVNFKLLECSNLVGLFSCVFVRDKEWENIRSEWTHVDMVKTGLKGYHGNKGGIATRFIVDDTSISFVNCHLAAGQSHTRQRNTDAANVLKKLCHPNPAISSGTVHPEVFWFGDGTMAMDHEICFLSGDLNYRIDVKFSEAVSRVQAQEWSHLHTHDQLLQQKQKNPQFVLRAFNESELRFAPTYKYDPGTDTYDTSSKHRTPAWCDRILWRGRHVRQLFYKRNECRVSDHRPISGGFVVGVKRIDEAQRRVVEQQVKEGWYKVQEKEIRIKKLAWLRSWGWNDPRVESVLDREGGDLAQVVRILSSDK
ncbi:hypothetical protein KI688_008045 [Linnemannia hyalina]|uniref:Inositol polyphosphate-related phosphatase domain-containing protein n=1 Tax=Linnemannia hyalina TaxID=64524 RepID=A0A9P7Y1L2_9FUNG|nr:hypothetical protein KI688_008045 [Linnemannia hyalina]